MATTKWTAGEWKAVPLGFFGKLNIVGPDGKPVAFTGVQKSVRSQEECEANAQLIALSPEWPEVLREMLNVFSWHVGDSPEETDAINDARALLAKLPK